MQVTAGFTKNSRSKDCLLWMITEYSRAFTFSPLPVLTGFTSVTCRLCRSPAAKPRCCTAQPCSSLTKLSCSPTQANQQTGALTWLPGRWIHGALPSFPSGCFSWMTSWFRDIYHLTNHLFSGACSVDGQEEPRVLQTRWRSEGPLRDDEEDEELILNEV